MMVALLLALVGSPTFAFADGSVVKHVLGNGVTVLVQEDRRAGVVAANLHIRGGSSEETSATAGITHFLQRVMLRGTQGRSYRQLVEAAEEIGGALDAASEPDYAELSGRALAAHWVELLTLMAEVALHPAVPADEVERERRLILSQIQTRQDTPSALVSEALLRDLYGSHPYALPSVGVRESVARITREALQARYQQLYRPDRLILAVSGRVPASQVVRHAERLFGGMAAVASASPLPRTPPPARTVGQRRAIEKSAQQAHVMAGFVGPAVNESDYAAVKVLSAVVGGGMSGRLFLELRDRRGLAYSVGVLNPTRSGPAPFLAQMGTSPASAHEAEVGLLGELARARTEPATAGELARAKAYLVGNLGMDRRTAARRAWYLAFFEGAGVGWDFPDRYARSVEAVTIADVQRVAERYLTHPTIVILQPKP